MDQTTLTAAQEIDFSLLALFARATITVQLVMISLIIASFWSWAIIIQKHILYRRARNEAEDFDAAFWSGEPLDELYDQIGPAPATSPQRVFAAGMTEWRRSHRADGRLIPGAVARIDRSMDVAITKETRLLTGGLTFLASVGSASPFVGLFGTVWGIKHAFEEIALAQSTNLAVVAPGIAEALLATGLGLLAAIPATIFYNKLTDDSDAIISGYEGFADEFNTILSRQLDAA
ncbi:MAG: protein TolQ [Roseinatronobacter sp.]|jgi:biopolymer transport protein TolQ|uniref:Tol-Pal system protein TolQ n=1 Tax=Roseinatronobacter monicus TaxID=393481 RepID=A0A543KC33_9RHOB|nr:protein TolQ [Roseinatronobacter monicus]TQM92635.1 cell division and transport-associated protein TolQ [Roseinatronobacter monicus]TVQ05262.1 MAG: protein TolQ [Roseinatronobacter sp.]